MVTAHGEHRRAVGRVKDKQTADTQDVAHRGNTDGTGGRRACKRRTFPGRFLEEGSSILASLAVGGSVKEHPEHQEHRNKQQNDQRAEKNRAGGLEVCRRRVRV